MGVKGFAVQGRLAGGLVITALFCLFLVGTPARAEMMSFEEQYSYDAGEADSKLSCRAISLLQVKQLLLERLGTYIESSSQVVDLQLTRDEVTSLSAGIVKTEILSESWDGKTYILTARIHADPEAVALLLNGIAGTGKKQEEMARLDQVNQEGLERINQLKSEMESVQSDLVAVNRDYQKASKLVDSWGTYERGMDQMRDGNFAEAVKSFTLALAANPVYVSYLQRGKAYRKLGKFSLALDDLKKVVELNPKVSEVYFTRGQILMDQGDKRGGREEISKAAKMGNGKAKLWLESKGGTRWW